MRGEVCPSEIVPHIWILLVIDPKSQVLYKCPIKEVFEKEVISKRQNKIK